MAHRKLVEFEKMRVQRMLILLVLVSFVIGFGTFALHYTEGWSLFEAFFFTLITVSTVGYSIPDEISTTSKVVISLLIASGISIVLYALTSLTSLVVEGHFQDYVRKRRIKRMIDNMKDHIIVVGAGRTGRHTVF
ncbi:potassium channel family protein [Thermotoga sp. Ku-13t]|uniref:potassium channel family protein n=1 Tax=Thermotoga sp. Ku-13t TaxID=1755813 RepID=UPI001F4A06B8|nr:potassium channel family protein [Thermotoga sp. Ku-13t]